MLSNRLIFYLITVLSVLGCVVALKCYSCNSLYKPYCSDPFDPPDRLPAKLEYEEDCDQKINEIKRNSSLVDLNNHIEFNGSSSYVAVCRKIMTKEGTQIRISRSCGFYDASKEPIICTERTSSSGALLEYCACRGDFCNHGSSRTGISLGTVLNNLWLLLLAFITRSYLL